MVKIRFNYDPSQMENKVYFKCRYCRMDCKQYCNLIKAGVKALDYCSVSL